VLKIIIEREINPDRYASILIKGSCFVASQRIHRYKGGGSDSRSLSFDLITYIWHEGDYIT